MNETGRKKNSISYSPGRRTFLKRSTIGLLFMNYSLGHLFSEDGQSPSTSPSLYGNMFIMESAPGAEAVINGKKCIYFGGTGYFGLQNNPEVIQAGIEAFKKFGVHIATSRTGFGNNPVLLEAEKKIAEFFGTEDAVYFPSGYLSNIVLVQMLADEYDAIFIDETAHFSIRDAIYSARKPVFSFRHRDPNDLRKQLRDNLKPGDIPLLMTDGVFPTFGLIAPVPDYIKALEPYNGIMCLDDAHAVGHLGSNGRGTYDYYGVRSDRLHFAGTLSKAFGGYGGFVPASRKLIDKVRASVGVYSGATPTPTPIAAATIKAIELVRKHPEWREKLRKNTALGKDGMKKLGFEMNDTPIPIITWTLKSAEMMKKVQHELWSRGIAVAYLKYVGAPAGGVLRASIFSTHSEEHIRRLLAELKKLL